MDSINPEKIDKCMNDAMPSIIHILWNTMSKNNILNQDDVSILTSKDQEENLEKKREIMMKIDHVGKHVSENFCDRFSNTDDNKIYRMIEKAQLVCRTDDDNADDELENRPWDAQELLNVKVKKVAKGNIIPKHILRSNPRGLVLLITMIDYNDPNRNRRSAKYDDINSFKLFQQLGFRVIRKTNITVNELNRFLKKYSKHSLVDKVDSLFVVISGHGGSSNDENNNSVIEFTDGLIPCSEVINYFSVENCPSMAGKPKLFIFQACRGPIKQRAREHNQNIDNPLMDLDIDKLDNKYTKVNDKVVRNFSDIFVVHSTLPNHTSYRNTKYGSYFIQVLCDVFQNYACRYSVQDLLLLIDARMAKLRFGNDINCQTITVKTIGVNKQLYLNPVVNNKPDWALE